MPEIFLHYLQSPISGFEAWLIAGSALALMGAAGLMRAVTKKVTVSVAFARVAPHAVPLMWLTGAHFRRELAPYGVDQIAQSFSHFAVLWVLGALLFVAAARIGESLEVPNALTAMASWLWILPGFYLRATAAALSDDSVHARELGASWPAHAFATWAFAVVFGGAVVYAIVNGSCDKPKIQGARTQR